MSTKRIPAQCPVCGAKNIITEVSCHTCDIHIRGEFGLGKLATLPPDLYDFTLAFLGARGNIKEVEKALGISYPTVRNRLDKVLEHLGLSAVSAPKVNRLEILKQLENGEINSEEAVELLKGGHS